VRERRVGWGIENASAIIGGTAKASTPSNRKQRDDRHHLTEAVLFATSDLDPDVLIDRLAGPLLPADRQAFREAALDALARVRCWGEGAVYRAVAAVQREFFTPPPDERAAPSGARHRSSKLAAGPPIGDDDPRSGRGRTRLRSVE